MFFLGRPECRQILSYEEKYVFLLNTASAVQGVNFVQQ